MSPDAAHWVRLFNRLEAAITHHKRDKGPIFADDADEKLWATRDKILSTAARSETGREERSDG